MTRPVVPLALPAKLAGLAGVVCLVAITLAHPSATRLHTWPWALVADALWMLPVLILVVGAAREPVWHLPGKALTAALVVLALGTVASAWASPFSPASLARTWPTLGGVTFCFVLHHWLKRFPTTSSDRADLVARVIAIAGGIVVGASLASWWYFAPYPPWSLRNIFPFGHSNYTAGFVVLILPWFVLRMVRTRKIARVAWGIAIVCALLVLVGTSSRGAAIAIVCVVALSLVAVLIAARWTRRQKFLLAAVALIFGTLVILLNPRLRDLAAGRGWSDAARESNVQRSAMLDAGMRLGLARPWLGWGPGSVPLAYPRVRAALDGGVDNVLQLHNSPVQLWATLGSAGILAMILLASGMIAAVVRIAQQPARSPLALAAIASLGGYALFSLTDHQLDLPAIAALAAADLALLTAFSTDRYEQRPGIAARVTLVTAVAALVGGPTIFLTCDLLARRFYEHALSARDAGQNTEFISNLESATRLTPYDPYFQHQVAGELLAARASNIAPSERERLTREAVGQLEASLSSTQVHAEFAHFNLGWALLDLGKPAEAARHFAAVARLVPDKGGVYFGLGLALQATGRRDDAVRSFALEWLNDPRSTTSPAWELPSLAALRPAVRAEAKRLYATLRTTFPPAAAAEAWTRWWWGETSVLNAMQGRGFVAEENAFAAALPAIGTRAPIANSNAAWARLYNAWLRSDTEPNAFVALAPNQPDYTAALARRAARHRGDFRAFLAAGTEDEPVLILTTHRERLGYGVLALHPDGPALTDIYIVQENRVVTDFAFALFPPKGWLPGRFLLALLPPDPR